MRIWRLVKTRHAARAFDGEGARLYGGRWNSAGVPAVYGADSAALAVLEVLVHLRSPGPLGAYSLVSADVPDHLITDIESARLPKDWHTFPVPLSVQALGDNWLRSAAGLALRVPSAVVAEGRILVINPGHSQFGRLVVRDAREFRFDGRLVG